MLRSLYNRQPELKSRREIGLMRDIALRTIAVLDAADPARHSAFFPGETVRKRAR